MTILKSTNDITPSLLIIEFITSDVAIGWVKRKKCKTTLIKDESTLPIYQLIERAENWLTSNQATFELRKWLTKDWGEIPADFGRK